MPKVYLSGKKKEIIWGFYVVHAIQIIEIMSKPLVFGQIPSSQLSNSDDFSGISIVNVNSKKANLAGLSTGSG